MFGGSDEKDKPPRRFQPFVSRNPNFSARKPSRDELVNTDSGYILYLEDITGRFDGF